jgi:hypothetical protein
VLARFAVVEEHWIVAIVGLAQTAGGAGVLVWAGVHYDDLHGPLREGADVVHPRAASIVGLATVMLAGVALASAVVAVATG